MGEEAILPPVQIGLQLSIASNSCETSIFVIIKTIWRQPTSGQPNKDVRKHAFGLLATGHASPLQHKLQ